LRQQRYYGNIWNFYNLRRKAPDNALRLEAASDPTVLDAEIIEEVQRVAKADPQVQTAMQETVAAVQADQVALGSLTLINLYIPKAPSNPPISGEAELKAPTLR
jgi:hypothetical protein